MTAMRRAAGFTLLELLIAITLLGLLMAALFGGIRLGARAWETSGERLERFARVQIVQSFLRERLTEILPLPPAALEDPAAEGEEGLAFHGEPDAITFVALLPERLGAGLATFTLGHDRGSEALVLGWRPVAWEGEGEPGPDAEETTRALLDAVDRVEVRYFGAPDPAAPRAWRETWRGDAGSLPELIAVRVFFREGERAVWPDLIVRPMITGTVGLF